MVIEQMMVGDRILNRADQDAQSENNRRNLVENHFLSYQATSSFDVEFDIAPLPNSSREKMSNPNPGQTGTFTCAACGATFKTQQELNQHTQQMHGGKK
jgi:hypothetical protein